ncbi:MAG: nitroreductase family protein [Chitinispirillales bacterium]|nr:nitroreductase family protein [Chitinispirillales bacterium]
MTSFLDLAATRYSVRSFCPRAIEPEKLSKVLTAARLAPTACNNQPQRIKVVSAPADLARIDECTPCRFGAPVVLLVCYDKTVCWRHPTNSALTSGAIDASIVTTHLMMAAQDAGLGSCWVMKFDAAKTSELFALPESFIPVAMLPTGYPAADAAPSDRHEARFDVEKIVF